jgi:DNA-binding MarR family transcriptional regulator
MPVGLSDHDYASLADFRLHIRKYFEFSREAVADAGLTPQQHQVLLGIKALGLQHPVVIRALADWLQLKHHSVIGLVDRLERRGLVRRERDLDDRRRVELRLTRPGATVLAELSRAHRSELRAAAPALVAALSNLLDDR